MNTERFSHFISRVYATELLELECSQMQSFLPDFVEAELQGVDIGAVGPAIHQHLSQCPDCAESYLALAHVVAYEAEEGFPTDTSALAGRREQN